MYQLLLNCLICQHMEIKKGACEIVTKICNREPDCKEFFTIRRFIVELMRIIDHATDDDFVTKALDALIGKQLKNKLFVCLFALSFVLIAILGDNCKALEFFEYNTGLSTFRYKLMSERDEWCIKIATYLEETCRTDDELACKM